MQRVRRHEAEARSLSSPPTPFIITRMPATTDIIQDFVKQGYQYGFVTDIESDSAPPGLNEDIVRLISSRKQEPEWLLEWRLKALRHWQTLRPPTWPFVKYPPIDFQSIDGRPVTLIWLLASPPDKTGPHIHALARISRLMTLDKFRAQLNTATSSQQVFDIILQQENAL